jgi:hypothetical protein
MPIEGGDIRDIVSQGDQDLKKRMRDKETKKVDDCDVEMFPDYSSKMEQGPIFLREKLSKI